MNIHENICDRLNRLNIDNILFNDINCWEYFKKEKIIYNKLWLTEIQGIPCGPIGTQPNKYPIIVKPIINLYGMSRSFKICNNQEEYDNYQKDGCFWTPYFEGDNYNFDLIFDKGKIIYYNVFISKPSVNGTFDCHYLNNSIKLSDKNKFLLEKYFCNYSGPMNIEVIRDNIIEGHLRLNGDCYIYDDDFFKNLSSLLKQEKYSFESIHKNIYLFPYFVNYTFDNKFLNRTEIEKILIDNNSFEVNWDNIDSNYQRNDLRRLLMYVCDSYKNGLEIRKKIKINLTNREKIFPYINGL